jgi:hypothetical protein
LGGYELADDEHRGELGRLLDVSFQNERRFFEAGVVVQPSLTVSRGATVGALTNSANDLESPDI